jgi:diguanylate cyclase (GGDEF)-like protein
MTRYQEKDSIAILMVDDDGDDFVIVRDLLTEITRGSYRIDWAKNFDEGLDAVETKEHDVYLLDYRLGEETGLDLLKEIGERQRNVPVILLTGSQDDELDFSALEAGAADFLVKGEITAPLLDRSIRYAIKHAQLTDALRDQAMRDGLTGLVNRREMDRILRQEVSRYERHATSFALLMVDIDHFKDVNDKHGHLIGDGVLKWIAQQLQETVRPEDTVARYGGEEMAIIAAHADAETANAIARRVQQRIKANRPTIDGGTGVQVVVPITVSIGVATLPQNALLGESLIAAADEALYEAKHSGRDCTVVSSGEPCELGSSKTS